MKSPGRDEADAFAGGKSGTLIADGPGQAAFAMRWMPISSSRAPVVEGAPPGSHRGIGADLVEDHRHSAQTTARRSALAITPSRYRVRPWWRRASSPRARPCPAGRGRTAPRCRWRRQLSRTPAAVRRWLGRRRSGGGTRFRADPPASEMLRTMPSLGPATLSGRTSASTVNSVFWKSVTVSIPTKPSPSNSETWHQARLSFRPVGCRRG